MSEKKLDLILTKLDSHENMIAQLMSIVATTNSIVSEMKQTQEQHGTEIKEIKQSNEELKQITTKILESQEEQKEILDTLSSRSIEHETKIKKIQNVQKNQKAI